MPRMSGLGWQLWVVQGAGKAATAIKNINWAIGGGWSSRNLAIQRMELSLRTCRRSGPRPKDTAWSITAVFCWPYSSRAQTFCTRSLALSSQEAEPSKQAKEILSRVAAHNFHPVRDGFTFDRKLNTFVFGSGALLEHRFLPNNRLTIESSIGTTCPDAPAFSASAARPSATVPVCPWCSGGTLNTNLLASNSAVRLWLGQRA